MNFNQLYNFLRICEAGGITQAAKKLYISQSALSQQIARIEEELNVRLFTYDGNRLHLTQRGAQFRVQAERMCSEYDKLKELMALPPEAEKRETLTLAVSKSHSMVAALYLIPRFKKRYPDVEINVSEVNSYEVETQLLERKADFGFCVPPKSLPIRTEQVMLSEVLVAVPYENEINRHSHACAGTYPLITPEELRNQTFIRMQPGSPRNFYAEMYFSTHNITPKYGFGVHPHDVIQKLVAAGYGCAFIPELSAYNQFRFYEQPIYYSTGDERFFAPLKIGFLEDTVLTPAMKDFIDFAQLELPNMPRELPLNTALHHAGDDSSLEY